MAVKNGERRQPANAVTGRQAAGRASVSERAQASRAAGAQGRASGANAFERARERQANAGAQEGREKSAGVFGRAQAGRSKEPARTGLTLGCANVLKCTGITSEDRVVIITDKETRDVGEGIRRACEEAGARVGFVMMEDLGKRPLTALPEATASAIAELAPTVSIFAATTKPGELGFRKPLISMLKGEFSTRHVHMPGITSEVVGGEAMCADYDEIQRITHAVYEAVKGARSILVTAPNGTRLEVKLDPDSLKWTKADGQIKKQGMLSNLPDGEVFTSPESVNGLLVTTVLGDYFTAKYGVLDGTPVTITIENGRAVNVWCKNDGIEKEVREYLFRGTNTERVGEFAIGTNVAVTQLIGNMLADEKAVGVHVAFGDPLADHTGANWEVTPVQHCDMVVQGTSVLVDGKEIMKDGVFKV